MKSENDKSADLHLVKSKEDACERKIGSHSSAAPGPRRVSRGREPRFRGR